MTVTLFYVKGFQIKGTTYVPYKSQLFDNREEAETLMEDIDFTFHKNGWRKYLLLKVEMETVEKII